MPESIKSLKELDFGDFFCAWVTVRSLQYQDRARDCPVVFVIASMGLSPFIPAICESGCFDGLLVISDGLMGAFFLCW